MKKWMKAVIIIVGIVAILAIIGLIYFKVTFISENEVKDVIADNMSVSSSDLYFESIDFEMDKNVYEVDVYYQNKDYEYKIDAKNGKIIYTDFNTNNSITNDNGNNNSNNSNTNGSSNNGNNATTASITVDEAKNIALTNANLTEDAVQFLRTEQEYENGVLVYEIDFTSGDFEYDYKINANTGEVVSYDRDSIYD